MEKKSVCWIRVAKNISYFLAPVLILLLILSVISILYVNETGMVVDTNKSSLEIAEYYQSNQFTKNYWNRLENKIYYVSRMIEKNNGLKVDETSGSSYSYGYYQRDKIYMSDVQGGQESDYYQGNANNFIYFIIDEKTQKIFGNIPYDISHATLESFKQEILANKYYWIYEDGKIYTSIPSLDEENIKYTDVYEKYLATDKGYTVYTAVRDNLPYFDDVLSDYMLFSIAKSQYQSAIYMIPIVVIVLIIMLCVVLMGIGRTRENKGISLSWFDKWPIEFAVFVVGFILFCVCGIAFSIGVNITAVVSIVSICIGSLALYIGCIILLETIVKRLKTHTFLKTTIGYWIYQKLKLVFQNMKLSVKIGVIFAGFILARAIIYMISGNSEFLAFLQLSALYAFCFIYILKRAVCQEKIHQAIEQIYKGNTNVKLNEEEYKGDLKTVAVQVNDIAGGLSNAIDEKMKSERLKTELITNVSHDIKTPLTSIINYVDLLKKEDITTEKAAEYLAILDNKSQRLKKLTEDLVEASKASSGNIKMNMEKLEVNELIKQVSAEFEEKFKAHSLEEIITHTKEPVYIHADSRYMYRVLENMYSNVSKYAMENTRVYTDIIEHGNNVIIQIKNISSQKLNISADELMQRFVRGDTSRNTEGSGLGLSIANSLTELQNGQFHIYLDGDLFKITIGFKKMQ